MDKRYSGYTLVEMLVVIAIMGFIAVIGFYALRNQDKSQVVINAQRDFLNNMRSTQNKVNTGADGLNTQSVSIPAGATVVPSAVSVICFNNSNLTTTPSCVNTCDINHKITVSFTNGSTAKLVTIECDNSGWFINRIYATD